jgi:hypothetical protein
MGDATKLQLTVVSLSLVALLLMSAAVEEAAAGEGEISYEAIKRGRIPGKEVVNDRPDTTANKYARGCEPEERCRGE